MRRSLLACSVLAVGLAALAAPLHAQKDKEPKRPRLVESADTNDAFAYYNDGLAALERDPKRAAEDFHWATRLNPIWADAYYAERVALLLTDRRRLVDYYYGKKFAVRSKQIMHADSLYLRALTLNPFLYQKLDRVLFDAIIRQLADGWANGDVTRSSEIQYYMNTWLAQAPAGTRAWRAYGAGDFPTALELWAQAIQKADYKAGYRTDRGRLLFQLDRADSALAELSAATAEMRKRDAKDLVYLYESKALMEQSVGMVHLRLGHTEQAREAFSRALQEDMSYYPAHVQLGFLAIDARDTATALSEMDLAVQLRDDDPGLHFQYGYTLAMVGRYPDAQQHLERAIALDPVYAAPHHVLAQVMEMQQKLPDALREYRAFLALASRNDPRREEAQQGAAALESVSGSAKP